MRCDFWNAKMRVWIQHKRKSKKRESMYYFVVEEDLAAVLWWLFLKNKAKSIKCRSWFTSRSALFLLSSKKYEEYDIIACCPHLFRDVKRFNETYIHDATPMYVLPIRMYGPTDVRELYFDIVDILEIYKKNPHNPVHFPGEECCFDTWRRKAFRHTPVPVLNPYKKPKKNRELPAKSQ